MATLSTDDKISLVESRPRGLTVRTFTSELSMVCALLNNGSIGGGSGYWGDAAHWNALDFVQQHLDRVRDEIKQKHEDDAGH